MDTVDLEGGDGMHEALVAAGPHAREALAQEAAALVRSHDNLHRLLDCVQVESTRSLQQETIPRPNKSCRIHGWYQNL